MDRLNLTTVRMWRTLFVSLLIYVAVSPAPTLAQVLQPGAPHIAAAAALQFALPEIVAAFTRSKKPQGQTTFSANLGASSPCRQRRPLRLWLRLAAAEFQALAPGS